MNEADRLLIEHTLDALAEACGDALVEDRKLLALYLRSVSRVRELPAGERRVRRDYRARRPIKPDLLSDTPQIHPDMIP